MDLSLLFDGQMNDVDEQSISQLKENRKLTIFPKYVISMWTHDTVFHANA